MKNNNNQIWNISNSLSMFRLLLSVPLYFTLMAENYILLICIILAIYISDLLDGYFARKFNQITEFGKMIDPIADKTLVILTVVVLLIQGKMPIWFASTVVLRDLLILIGGLFVKSKIGKTLQSDYFGKVTVVIIAITLIIMIFNINAIKYYCLYISTIMMILSLLNYGKNAIKALKVSKQ